MYSVELTQQNTLLYKFVLIQSSRHMKHSQLMPENITKTGSGAICNL